MIQIFNISQIVLVAVVPVANHGNVSFSAKAELQMFEELREIAYSAERNKELQFINAIYVFVCAGVSYASMMVPA